MQTQSRTIQATPVAPGIAIGRVMLLHSSGFRNVPEASINAGDTAANHDQIILFHRCPPVFSFIVVPTACGVLYFLYISLKK